MDLRRWMILLRRIVRWRWWMRIIWWIMIASIMRILGIWRILWLWRYLIHLSRAMILILNTIYPFVELFYDFTIFLLLFCHILGDLLIQKFQISFHFCDNPSKLILQHRLYPLLHCFSKFFYNHSLYFISNAFINTYPSLLHFFLLFL